jgi:hypothetical protein
MKRHLGLAKQAILAAAMGPITASGYLWFLALLRTPLKCTPGQICADFRGLDDIPVALSLYVGVELLAAGMAVVATKKKLPGARLALIATILTLLAPFIFIGLQETWHG